MTLAKWRRHRSRKAWGREGKLGAALLKRVLYWTGGHPYLTQRLCQSVGEDRRVTNRSGVDRHCESLFLSSRARERDDNLLFVRERLLRSEVDLADLLDLYRQVHGHKNVRDDEMNPLVSILRLSSITRVVNGSLSIRNRIYSQVFDLSWVEKNMPGAELRRQRAAYLSGLRAANLIGFLLVFIMIWWIGTSSSSKLYEISANARKGTNEYMDRLRLALNIQESAAEVVAEARVSRLRQLMRVPVPSLGARLKTTKKRFQDQIEEGKEQWSSQKGHETLTVEELAAWREVEKASWKFLKKLDEIDNSPTDQPDFFKLRSDLDNATKNLTDAVARV